MRTTVAADYKIGAHDAGETVTFTSGQGIHSVAISIPDADGHEFTADEVAASGGMYQLGDKTWVLGRALITDAAHYPRPGDKITDSDGVSWYVKSATLDDLDSAFTVVCHREK